MEHRRRPLGDRLRLGAPVRRRSAQRNLLGRPLVIRLPRKLKAARNMYGSTKGTDTLSGRHVGAVAIGRVGSVQEGTSVGNEMSRNGRRSGLTLAPEGGTGE